MSGERGAAGLKPGVERVRAALAAAGAEIEIVRFAESTRTVAEAAATIGTSEAQIVKSLVFMAGEQPVVVLMSGTNRVDTRKLSEVTGAKVRRADAEEARAATGYAIGGTPPVGHATRLPVYIDADLPRYDVVWAAAGTPYDVFPIAPAELARITGAPVHDLRAE